MRRALAFLTPIGGARAPTPSTLGWFPIVGAALGAALGGWWWLAATRWPPMVASALVVAGDLAATGMLHFDGLLDAADGLLPHLSLARRLEVMQEPAVGAFGVGVGAAVLLVRWAALAALVASPWLLVGIWSLSRAAMAVGAATMPYARPEGLARAFLDGARTARAGRVAGALGMVIGGGALLVWHVGAGACTAAAVVAGALGVLLLARRRLGGFTGDVLGAAGLVGETVALVVAAARW